ncbi:hypothetical protein J7T55_011956 [Diaporthe amygdali]|uniref:uncharacterized protein n=1 Tax=Phomopsis amygdali TaxID=1214568 RepID=UPI0022FE935C|nr:uncharacterized protein J7T55_011956 [Diaporthe amygdali]KAJ0123491.1 hypothetical protein J7T55_011956 [Diaporthe amygdali]
MHQPPRGQQQPEPVPAQTEPTPSTPHVTVSASAPPAASPAAPPPTEPPIPPSFARRKAAILAQLAVPDDEYTDLSPKGTVDAGIRDLIDEINGLAGLVTTSSCAGRVSVFLEGRRAGRGGPAAADESHQLPGHPLAVVDGEGDGEDVEDGATVGGGVRSGGGDGGSNKDTPSASAETVAGVGGKGGGGRWLFVSHEPVESHGKLDSEPNIVAALLGMEEPIFDGKDGSSAEEMGESRLIHFKFEPMILHVLTASPQHAQLILRCGLQAGFRESGAINLIPSPTASSSTYDAASATPIVAIRSMGLGLESLIGRETNGIKHCTVSVEYLRALVKIANERFAENTRRIARFRTYLKEATAGEKRKGRKGEGGGDWEDAEVRRERKRLEGLKRAEEARKIKEQQQKQQESEADETPGLDSLEQIP